jgi:hypothetical protein
VNEDDLKSISTLYMTIPPFLTFLSLLPTLLQHLEKEGETLVLKKVLGDSMVAVSFLPAGTWLGVLELFSPLSCRPREVK